MSTQRGWRNNPCHTCMAFAIDVAARKSLICRRHGTEALLWYPRVRFSAPSGMHAHVQWEWVQHGHADSAYGACVAATGCRQPVRVVSGSLSPAMDTAYGGWARLTDGQTRTVYSYAGWGDGTRTIATSASPYITLQLDSAYDDISGTAKRDDLLSHA